MGGVGDELMSQFSKHENWLSQQTGVTATGIGIGRDGKPVAKVYTNQISEDTKSKISAVLAGLPFEFEETGEFRAL